MKPNNGMTDIGIPQKLNDRIGSVAAPGKLTSSAAAFECEAEVRAGFSSIEI